MGKKKGRQSGNFGSKAMKAAFRSELRDRMGEVSRRPARFGSGQRLIQNHRNGNGVATTMTSSSANRPSLGRPKLASLTQLRGILLERQVEDSHIYRDMRRRLHQQRQLGAFATSAARTDSRLKKSAETSTRKRPVPGYMLYWGDKRTNNKNGSTINSEYSPQRKLSTFPTLQKLCIDAVAPVLSEYIDAWGVHEVHAVLSMLPPHMLSELSVAVSSTTGITSNDIAVVLAKHTHIERLALHAPHQRGEKSNEGKQYDQTIQLQQQQQHLTDNGLLQLVPKLASSLAGDKSNENQGYADGNDLDVPDSWEEQLEDQEVIEMEGCIRLKRLELVNIQNISWDAASKFFAKASGITHLSLSGSLSCQVGEEIFPILPKWLPNLKVIDLSYCPWVSEILIRDFWTDYLDRETSLTGGGQKQLSSLPLPVIMVRGCFALSAAMVEDLMYEFGGKLLTKVDCLSVPSDVDDSFLDIGTTGPEFISDMVPLQWSADPF